MIARLEEPLSFESAQAHKVRLAESYTAHVGSMLSQKTQHFYRSTKPNSSTKPGLNLSRSSQVSKLPAPTILLYEQVAAATFAFVANLVVL